MSHTHIPRDISLQLPKNSALKPEDQHYLLFIPWQDSYIEYVPSEYREFFLSILPYLAARTTDVHTAVCMQYLDEFVQAVREAGGEVNRNVLAYALMLHDSVGVRCQKRKLLQAWV